MAETEQEKINRLNRHIARKLALWRVCVAMRNGFKSRAEILNLGLAKSVDIDLAIEVGHISEGEEELIMLQPIQESMWRELEPQTKTDIPVIEKLIAPTLPGCKCRNGDQSKPPYWFFTGSQADISAAARELIALGITVFPEANGLNGNYKMKLPIWVAGQLILGAQPKWKETTEENNVTNSFANTATNSNETSFSHTPTVQGQITERTTF